MTSQIPGFTQHRIATNGTELSVHIGGEGPPLILLHGYPQTHMAWARVAPEFAKRFQVIAPDLRGYGESAVPPDDTRHTAYSKRTMARDIVGLIDILEIEKTAILGHDRGARVTYRLALDHPDKVTRIGIIEIVPTGDFWASFDADLALAAYHWPFLAQPAPLPESLIAGDPVGYLEHTLTRWTLAKSLDVFSPKALESYRAQMRDPARVAAMCADYRAGASSDRALDEADQAKGRKITVPICFLWAENGFPARTGDPAGIWRRWATDVTDASCRSGHFAMDENPQAVLDTFLPFFSKD